MKNSFENPEIPPPEHTENQTEAITPGQAEQLLLVKISEEKSRFFPNTGAEDEKPISPEKIRRIHGLATIFGLMTCIGFSTGCQIRVQQGTGPGIGYQLKQSLVGALEQANANARQNGTRVVESYNYNDHISIQAGVSSQPPYGEVSGSEDQSRTHYKDPGLLGNKKSNNHKR